MQTARYVRLFTDAYGETHFEDLKVQLKPQDFAPPAAPLNLANFHPVSGSFWLGAPGDWKGDAPHATPQRQIFCTVEGEYEVTASDGEVRCFPTGSVLFLDDTTGKGHQTRITNERGALVFAVAVADEVDGGRAV
jgi:uncharacterized cupin superfamily protein